MLYANDYLHSCWKHLMINNFYNNRWLKPKILCSYNYLILFLHFQKILIALFKTILVNCSPYVSTYNLVDSLFFHTFWTCELFSSIKVSYPPMVHVGWIYTGPHVSTAFSTRTSTWMTDWVRACPTGGACWSPSGQKSLSQLIWGDQPPWKSAVPCLYQM